MLRCVPGPVVLVVLSGEADTPALAVCACLGACVTGPTLRARLCWVVCQICACMRWAVLIVAPMPEKAALGLQVPMQCTTRLVCNARTRVLSRAHRARGQLFVTLL